MNNNFEDKYIQFEKNWWFFKARRELILQLIKDIHYDNVLEIGCGSGELSNYLKNYVGIDISKHTCKFIIGDAQRLPFKDYSFDLILLLDIIEHVDDKKVMSEVYRILKTNGKVIITVPAFNFLWSQHDVDNHHIKRYRRGEIPLKNFEIEKFTYWNFFLFPIVFMTKNKKEKLVEFPEVVNYILTKILRFENYLISKNVRLPIGVTLIYKLKTKTI